MQVKISQAIHLLTIYIKAKLVPIITSSPGIGKSAIVHAIGEEYNLKLLDLRLGQCDITDLNGFPNIDQERKRAGYLPMETFPIEGDPLPEGYSGWLLFLDELTSASPAVQAASYKIILDRKVGIYNLHPRVVIVGAGNLETDNAVVQAMSTALQSRLAHIELVVDHEEFIQWAQANNVDHRITSYIAFKPSAVYTFSPDHSDRTYACPRTWKFADQVIKTMDDTDPLLLHALSGVLSEGVAREFMGFMRIHDDLPKVPQILLNPEGFKIPEETSILYALAGSLAQHADKDNMTQLMKFIKRMPLEFQVFCLKDAVRRNKPLLAHPAVQAWIASSAASLF